MISRIIMFLMLPSLIIAVFLSLGGVSAIPMNDTTMYSFFRTVFERFNSIAISIPDIPSIPKLDYVQDDNVFVLVLNALIFVVRLLIVLLNGLISLINFLSTVVSIVIQLVEYVFVFIYSLKDLRNILQVSAVI